MADLGAVKSATLPNGDTIQFQDQAAVRTAQGSQNEGKILKVNSSGNLALAEAPTGLPAVTSSDNGKFLTVVNGAWAATTMQSWQGGSY